MKSTNQVTSKKKLKTNKKKVIQKLATLNIKDPALSKNVEKRVAKNVLSQFKDDLQGPMNKEIVKILLSFSDPKDFPPVRLGSQWGSNPTAVANPTKRIKTGWVNPTSAISDTVDTAAGFLFRDAFRFFVFSQTWNSQTSGVWKYSASYNGQITCTTQFNPLITGRMGSVGTGEPHGRFLYPARVGGVGRTYYPLSYGNILTITNNSAGSISARPFYIASDGTIVAAAVANCANGGATTSVFLNSGPTCLYVGMDISCATDMTFNATVAVQGIVAAANVNQTLWCHRSLPDVDTNVVASGAMKIYGASLKFTNEASPLNRQGKEVACQVPAGADWRDYSTYDQLAGLKDAYDNSIENGYYGFLQPTQPEDLGFTINHEEESGANIAAWYEATPPSDFLAFNGVVTTSAGQDAYYTITAALEYRTPDQWREVSAAVISPDVVLRAMALLAQMPQHHENPFHVSDIFNWIGDRLGDAWKGVKEAFPHVVRGLETAGKVATIVAPLMAL